MGAENKQVGLLLAKIEGTYGTDPTPTGAANAIAVVRDTVNWAPQSTRRQRVILDGTTRNIPGFNSLVSNTISFRTELVGNRTNGSASDISNGTSAEAIPLDPLFKSCDFMPTYTAAGTPGTSRDGYVTYKPTPPADGIGSSCTLWFYTGLKLHKMSACKGSLKITYEAGNMAYIDWTFQGTYVAVSDASLATPTFVDTKPPLFVGSALTFDSYSPVLTNVTFDLGNNLVRRLNALSTNGIIGSIITGRDSKATIDPESVAEATHPFWADWLADEVDALVVPIGTQTGNLITLTCNTQMTDVKYADRDATRIKQIQLACTCAALSSAVGSDVSLKFF